MTDLICNFMIWVLGGQTPRLHRWRLRGNGNTCYQKSARTFGPFTAVFGEHVDF